VTRAALPIERAWSGRPGTVAWTRLLGPLAWVYGRAAADARRRSAGARERVPEAVVVAFGGLTVGGSGKSSVVRWFARRLAASGEGPAAVLLRGYGADRRGREPEMVPDYDALDPTARFPRYGDDALAHRAGLPQSVAVVVGADRRAAARAAVDGFGARVLLLDDGWEQRGIAWDRLVVVLDPDRPAGNGRLLPAGPLRRPVSSLSEASILAFVLEGETAAPPGAAALVGPVAPAAGVLLLRRRPVALAEVGVPGGSSPESGCAVGLVSGVGSPDRLTRFVRDRGFRVAGHAAFGNHARWRRPELERAVGALRRAGAVQIWITEKDEPRWPRGFAPGLPVRVLRTELEAVGPAPDPAELVRAARAGGRPLAGPAGLG
jgi:tetraacyldisaccharide 4'-kinase